LVDYPNYSSNNTVTGNTVTGSATGIYLDNETMTSLGSPTNNTVSNNAITGNTTGIYLTTGVLNAALIGNTLSGNTTGINDSGTGTIYANQMRW